MANGGICSGYPKNKINTFYPTALHHDDKDGMPKQNVASCSMDHAYVVYKDTRASSPSPGTSANAQPSLNLPSVKLCFIYTFNSFKNIRYGHRFTPAGDSLPCRIKSWSEIDIILSIPAKVTIVPLSTHYQLFSPTINSFDAIPNITRTPPNNGR